MARYYCIVDGADYHERYEVKTLSAMKAAEQYGKKGQWEMVSIVRKKTYQLLSRVVYDGYVNKYRRSWLGKNVRYYEYDEQEERK